MLDVLKGYLQVANGLTDVTVARARELAEAIASQGLNLGSKSQEQVSSLTDELMDASRTNRDLLTGLIRTEVDRAVGRMGFVREEELAAVRSHVQRLEDQLHKEHQRVADRATGVVLGAADASQKAGKNAVETAVGTATKTVADAAGMVRGLASVATGETPAVAKPAAKRAARGKPTGTKPAGTKATGPQPAGSAAPAKSSPGKSTSAQSSAVKKPPADTGATSRTTPRKPPARKATP